MNILQSFCEFEELLIAANHLLARNVMRLFVFEYLCFQIKFSSSNFIIIHQIWSNYLYHNSSNLTKLFTTYLPTYLYLPIYWAWHYSAQACFFLSLWLSEHIVPASEPSFPVSVHLVPMLVNCYKDCVLGLAWLYLAQGGFYLMRWRIIVHYKVK